MKLALGLFMLGLQSALTLASAQASPVTLIEFSDFQCPFCQRAVSTVAQIQADYGTQVQFEFKNFPLSFHQNARSAALAGICAKEQSQFKGMHDLLFANQSDLNATAYTNDAKALGLNLDQFTACLTSQAAEASLLADLNDAALFHVNSTPAFFLVTDSKVVKITGAMPYATFKAQLDLLLPPVVNPAPTPSAMSR